MAKPAPLAPVVLALALDRALGEPPALIHPVVWMGQTIAAAERLAPPQRGWPQLWHGGLVTIGGAVLWGAACAVLLRGVRARAPWLLAPLGAAILKTTLSLRALEDAALAVAEALATGRLDCARQGLRALVSRDASALDAPLVAAAAVESVAENLSDSLVAPLVWYALLGVPGAVAYRFLNTCDAMLGYRGRYEYLGKAAARVDDLANLAPARLTAVLLVLAARSAGADARGAWATARRDHGRTASPNAGWPMSAMAGALGVRLEKREHYLLGDGAPPTAATVRQAVRLARHAALLAVGGYALAVGARRACAAAAA